MNHINPLYWPRWIAFFIALGLFFTTSYTLWTGQHERFNTQLQALQNPGEHAGTRICVGYLLIESIETWGVVATDKGGYRYPFAMNPVNIEKGHRYSFRGTISVDGKIRVENFQHHPYNVLKYAFSLLSLVLVVYIIRMYIRFDLTASGFKFVNPGTGLFGTGRSV